MDVNSIILKITGKQPINNNIKPNIWKSWYVGKVDGFHNFRLYNGSNYIDIEKKSLLMAKTVCEDWADLLANEKTKIQIPDVDQEKLDCILTDNGFASLLNMGVEKTFSLGQGCFVLGLKGKFLVGDQTHTIKPTKDTKISIDFVDAFSMKVLNIEHKKITECAFVSENTEYTELSIHSLNEKGNYEIANFKIDKKTDSIMEYFKIDTQNNVPWFFPFAPNINNNSFFFNDLGMSIYANAIDVLKTIDDIYDSFSAEYVLSRRKVYVSSNAYKMVRDERSGQMVRTFNPYDELYYDMGEGPDGKPSITTDATPIRDQSYINGINMALNILSKKCGFGTERYKFDKGSIATATQVISENSDMARSLRKQENSLRTILINMAWAIKHLNNQFTLQPQFSDYAYTDISINFDDSIIEDENAIKQRDRQDVEAGLMTEEEYRMKHFGKTNDDIDEENRNELLYKSLNKYLPLLQGGVITPELFVEKTYGPGHPEMVEYITAQMNKASYDPMEMFNESMKDNDDMDKEQEDEEHKECDEEECDKDKEMMHDREHKQECKKAEEE